MADKGLGHIVAVFNEKGGSGKTTTSCQLAGALAYRGYDVLVADLDPQQTSSAWIGVQQGANFPAQCWSGFRYGEQVVRELGHLAGKYEIIVVDCAPSVEQKGTWGALLAASIAIVPTRLNPQDLAALPAAKRMVRKAWEATGRDFPARTLPTAARPHLADERAAIASLTQDDEIPVLSTKGKPLMFGDRKAFPRSMLVGGTVHAIQKSEDSVREVEAAADEVLRLLGLPREKGAKR